jgi:DNA modification methylase
MQRYDDLPREALIEILKRRDRERKLGLVWERQEIEADRSINDDFVILDEDPGLSFADGPRRNLVIEADNYDALRWLRVAHRNAIKFIYIDPPYNTGNKTFIYNDNYVDPEDRYRHSMWIEFMYQRLVLARDLLTPDGLIFVSIDDAELARLRLLMDIVFPGQFQACLVWQSDGTGDNQAAFKVKHEYILVYSLDKSQVLAPPVIDPNIGEDSKLYNKKKQNSIIKNSKKNPVSDLVLPAGFPANFAEGIIEPRSGQDIWPKHTEPIIVENWRVRDSVTVTSGWQNKNLCQRFVAQGFAPVIDDHNQLTSFVLTRTGAIDYSKPRSDEQSYVISVIRNVGSVQKTRNDLEAIGVDLDYPKPVGLIEYLLRMMPGNDFIALDFFAGTGTTAEATMRLNSQDDGRRSFIMVSSTEATEDEPRKNICRDACAKRIAHYFRTDGSSYQLLKPDLFGFTYMRARREQVSELDEVFRPANVWQLIQELHGLPIGQYDRNLPVHLANNGVNLIVYADRVTDELIQSVREIPDALPLIIYTWSPGRFREALLGKTIELRAVPDYFAERFAR